MNFSKKKYSTPLFHMKESTSQTFFFTHMFGNVSLTSGGVNGKKNSTAKKGKPNQSEK